MTSSAGASGLICFGSPPSSTIASRIVARSTTHGTPVKSCMSTRAGVNWISVSGSASGSQPASARMWSAVMLAPSSVRSRFSSSTLRLNGSAARRPPRRAGRSRTAAADLEGAPRSRSCPCSCRCSPMSSWVLLASRVPVAPAGAAAVILPQAAGG